jgi:hypothetical protein
VSSATTSASQCHPSSALTPPTARRIVTAVGRLPLMILTTALLSAISAAQTPFVPSLPRVRAEKTQAPKSRPRDDPSIPYPYATAPEKILANIAAAVQQSRADKLLGIEALAMRKGELRARRILDVTSLSKRPDFYVVELEDRSGALVAHVAITKEGAIMYIGDSRASSLPASLNVPDAESRARQYTRETIRRTRYVWMENDAEPGGSVFLRRGGLGDSEGGWSRRRQHAKPC